MLSIRTSCKGAQDAAIAMPQHDLPALDVLPEGAAHEANCRLQVDPGGTKLYESWLLAEATLQLGLHCAAGADATWEGLHAPCLASGHARRS